MALAGHRKFEEEHRQEVPLSGVLAEFRDALRAEVDAARRAVQGSAVQLVHGQLLGRVADAHQYVFRLENPQLALPDDMPGDLYVGKERYDATVVSLAGGTITISVPQDLGGHVGRATLSSNLTNLLRALIERIEDFGTSGRPNPAGARLLGQAPPSGVPVAAVASSQLNQEQAAAVASGLGRDTTFIQGPPGTGKTKTIGALGEQLALANRSVLLVSHTNTAVDQALLHIAQALGPDVLEKGLVLRLGQPKDERVSAQPNLLVATHVERRSADLVARRVELLGEREGHVERLEELDRFISLCRWAARAAHELTLLEETSAGAAGLRAELHQSNAELEAHRVPATLARAELLVTSAQRAVDDARARHRGHQAQIDQALQVRLLEDRLQRLPGVAFTTDRVLQLEVERSEARGIETERLNEVSQAQAVLDEASKANAMMRRLRRLPHPDAQSEVLRLARDRLAETQARAGGVERELLVAQAQQAETERLGKELERWRELPSVDELEAALLIDVRLTADSEAALGVSRQDATTLLERVLDGEHRTGEATTALVSAPRVAAAALLRDLAAGKTIVGGVSEFETRATAAAARLDELQRRQHQLSQALSDALESLAAGLGRTLGQLEYFGFPIRPTADQRLLLSRVRETLPRIEEEARRHDPEALSLEMGQLRVRIDAIAAEVKDIEEQLQAVEGAVIADATVLATTLTRAYLRDEVQNRRFDTVILDEASMAPIPALWVAAGLADHNVVIVGDPEQLPPIALAANDKDRASPASKWLARDVFEVSGVTDTNGSPIELLKLRTQYRMHPAISALPNALVYGGELRDGPGASDDSDLDPWYERNWGHDAPVLLVDTNKADAWCSTVAAGGSRSRLNFLSATIAVDLAERLLRQDREPPKSGVARIIIATPFRPQGRLLTLLLREQGLEGEVIAGTVHSFQGSEAPVVIYDLVLDEPHRLAGLFAPDYDDGNRRQFNVGLTRARDRLFVIADFQFLEAHSKKAFLGQLLAELKGAPTVDAEDVVEVGLSARAAYAQGLARGQLEPDGADRLAVTHQDFDTFFLADLAAAERRIVIYSPFITHNRLDTVGPQLRAAVERGVNVYVVTKTQEERPTGQAVAYRDLTDTLRRWGIQVIPKKAMHEKHVFVDDDVVWIGSLNPLSFRDTREIMERRRSRTVAADFRQTLQLDIALTAYEDGETACPICGSDMALAEGPRGTFRRCVIAGCYSRGLAEPPLRGGKMACHTCGGELFYGAWGDKPAWRCRDNARHHMDLHPNHLRLPAMTALLSKKEDVPFAVELRDGDPGLMFKQARA